jgi:hypothetical protein
MNAYVTHSDFSYAPRMILMLESLRKFDSESPIFVFCHDSKTTSLLESLSIENTFVINDLETIFPELALVKASRSNLEYLYSLSPYIIEYVFLRNDAKSVTYLDADLYFFNDPNMLLSTSEETNVVIVSHQFPEKFSHLNIFGKYNVGWLQFNNSKIGRLALNWWKLKCTESTSETLKGEVYGDQKYLDSFPDLFPGVEIRENIGENVAPWNLLGKKLILNKGKATIDGRALYYFHYSGFRILGKYYLCGTSHYNYRNRIKFRNFIYKPYVAHLEDLHKRLMLPIAADTRKTNFKMHLRCLLLNDFLLR